MPSADEIYRAHSQTVYRYLLSLTHSEDLAEELTQETFYQAVKSLSRYDGSCKISTWLCSIAKNVLRSYSRKYPPSEELDERVQNNYSIENQVISQIDTLTLMKNLHSMGGDTREVMYLRLLGSLSFREIGEILDKSENWARVTYYRGKEKLRKELDSDE